MVTKKPYVNSVACNDRAMVTGRTRTAKAKSNKCLCAGLYLEVRVPSAAQFPVPGASSSHEM